MTNYATAAFSSAYTTSFFVVMNKDKWNSLPKDIQKIIGEINKEWAVKHGEAWNSSDIEGIMYFLNQGGKIIGVAAKEQKRWKEAVAPIIDDYVKETDAKKINGREVVDFITQTMKNGS